MTANEKLKSIVEKKLKTTMIGAVYAIEQEFGIIWDKKNGYQDPSGAVPKELLDKLTDVRDSILDLGNNQIRMIKTEIEEYFEIKQRIYHTEFKVVE